MRLLVVDGNSIVNRAFYGIRPLTNKEGQFTQAIYGFLTMLRKIEKDLKLTDRFNTATKCTAAIRLRVRVCRPSSQARCLRLRSFSGCWAIKS